MRLGAWRASQGAQQQQKVGQINTKRMKHKEFKSQGTNKPSNVDQDSRKRVSVRFDTLYSNILEFPFVLTLCFLFLID